MTRQHFRAIAAVVAGITDHRERQRTAYALAATLARFNGSFDRDRFIQACGA